ncbi:MAG: type II secretion system protein [Deltaproteobacteria bacterium]|nr:MAG: type II secretion system protein [Deltaproteobacteria bacterium]
MRARGMTLIEIGIAMAIAAGLLAMAIPAISNVTRVQLRQKSGQLGSGVRSLYGATALAGHSCRLVLDLDKQAYWSECAEGAVRLDRAGEQSAGGSRRDSREEELLASIRPETANEEEQVKLALAQKSAFKASGDIPKTDLGGSVRFLDVWVQHQSERYTTGKAFLYFWPSGLTEVAAIHLGQGDDVNTLLISPLSGRVRIVSGRVDAEGQR